jgi:hypothetical protein
MKKILAALAIVIVLISVIYAQNPPYFRTVYIRTLLYLQPEATFTNTGTTSLTGATTLSGATTVSGAATFSSSADFDGAITAGTGFWAGAPSIASNTMSSAFFWSEDFIGVGIDTTSAALSHFIGWNAAGDGVTLASAAGTLGGIVSLTPSTGSNNEYYVQLGELGTETFVEIDSASSKKLWVEFRITTDATTDAGNIFVGLAEEGSAAANFIDDAGNDFADKDLIGFVIWEGNPDTTLVVAQTSGGALDTVGTATDTIAAATYYSFGIYFDGDTTISYYKNGTAESFTSSTEDALYPDAEELSPIVALKNGAADKTVSIDWIKIVSER